ncbi:MAG: carboxypeptidase-like regulatory domain-containing protein, partial [Steroidobacteraceae bacterium]
GAYVISGVPPGSITAEGVAGRSFEIRGDTAFDIQVPSTQLGGRVLEEGSDIPIVGAGIHVTRMQAALPSNIQIQEETDHFGRFAAIGLDAGEILLSVYKPGYEMYRERLDYNAPVTNMMIRLRPSSGVEVRVKPADRLRRHLFLRERTETGLEGIQLRIALDENGVGSLPSALAGSTFEIYGGGRAPILIREWDAQPLELRF